MEKRSCYCKTHSLPFPFIFCQAIVIMNIAAFTILTTAIIVIPAQLFLSSRPSAASGGICFRSSEKQ